MKPFRTSGVLPAILAALLLAIPLSAAVETTAPRFSFGLSPLLQEPAPGPAKKSPVRFFLGASIGWGTLKNSAASRLESGKSGFMFDFNGGISFFNIVDVGVGSGLLFLSDKNPFTNSTTGGELESSVTPLFYYAQAGLQLPVPIRAKNGRFPVWLACHVGVMGVSVDRSIPMCYNCDIEKLSMTGKSFIRPEIRLQIEGSYVALAYTLFCNCSDFKSMFALTWTVTFGDQ